MMEKGPILSPYSVLTSSFIDVCVIQNLYFSTQNQAVGHALWEGLPSGYLTPNPSPSLSNSSCQPRNLYLRPWTEARGELLVKQPLQRLQGGQGPDDFSGGRRTRRRSEISEDLTEASQVPSGAPGPHTAPPKPPQTSPQACQHWSAPPPRVPSPLLLPALYPRANWSKLVVIYRPHLPLFSHTRPVENLDLELQNCFETT